MNNVNLGELIAFILYFLIVLGMGVYFFIRGRKDTGEKSYFLGGRKMGGVVAALSAGASDMSAWVLMGLPGSIYLAGVGQIWISVGLLIGTILAWVFVAPKLRRYSMLADDSITIPQYLTRRFKSSSSVLQVVCAVIFIIVYCVYGASSINACGSLLNSLFGLDPRIGMMIATLIIIAYVFLGGFNAVCWTDFFQGMLMLAALLATPIVAVFMLKAGGPVAAGTIPENYYNVLSSGKFDWDSISNILTGLGWGLGYFGMPHIIVRYISIRSEKEMKKSRWIGILWTTLILVMASVVGIVGRKYLGDSMVDNKALVFVQMARTVFPIFLGGVIISAIIAASMSTADSQLLASSSAFASDVYKTTVNKKASDKNVMWVGRIVVIAVSVLALGIAVLGTGDNPIVPAFSTIMSLVSAAWGAFGAAFGPIILLSLYWRRLNYKGAVAGIVTGFAVDILWMIFLNLEYYDMKSVVLNTKLYEIIPGFVAGLIAAVAVSLCTKEPGKDVTDLFDRFKRTKSLEESDLSE